jgi:hypothetical protein
MTIMITDRHGGLCRCLNLSRVMLVGLYHTMVHGQQQYDVDSLILGYQDP